MVKLGSARQSGTIINPFFLFLFFLQIEKVINCEFTTDLHAYLHGCVNIEIQTQIFGENKDF